jgi:hypothetical protein
MKIQFSSLRILIPAVVFLLLAMGGKSVSVPVIQNECIVEGAVAEYAIVSSRLINIEPDQVLYRLVITVQSAKKIDNQPNFLSGKEGQEISFLTKEKLSPELFGKKIQAKARYSGDERGGRYWIRNVQLLD